MIVNADDFGYDGRINRAIVRAFDEGLISSTTLMATMPGFDDACALARERGLAAHVGAHLVLTEGEPLTEAVRSCRRFCDASGRFFDWRWRDRALWLTPGERRAVAEEWRAQVGRCRAAGLPLTHLDSHHQAHARPGLAPVAARVARELGVPAVRVAENCSRRATPKHRAAMAAVNLCLRASGCARTRWFGSVEDYAAARASSWPRRALDDIEVMTHPGLEGELLVDRLAPGVPLHERLAAVPGHGEAVSYAGARYPRSTRAA